jgi:hypothetical protein
MKHVHNVIVSAVSSIILLSGCQGTAVRDAIGLDKSSPDEFRVVSRPPLSVPPQFSLRPPGDTSGAAPSVVPSHVKAQSLILNDGEGNTYELPAPNADTAVIPVTVSSPQANSAEAQFLKNAGADVADSSVRNMLEEEKINRQIKKEESSWWDSMSVWEKKEPIVDAKKESERIQKNTEEGKPVNDGDVAETKEKDRGVLGRILGDW